MPTTTDATLTESMRGTGQRVTGASEGYDPLMDRIDNARFVLLGEASHGTHEFYHERAQITQRLIEEKGFTAVAVEADWPDAYRVNRYVHAASDDVFAIEALADFRRFPTWMWRNTDVVEFLEWLHDHNEALSPNATKTGFYGLDLYSLRASMEPCYNTSRKLISMPRGAPVLVTRASISLVTTSRTMASLQASALPNHARRKSSHSSSSCSGGRWSTPGVTVA